VLAPAARDAASAVGIELSPAMAERARAAVPGAEVVVGDASALPFDDASFDVVLASFVVFFLPDPTAALREWRRVLAPGGRLVISTWGGSDPRWQSWERPLRGSFVPEMDPARAQELGAALALINRFDNPEKLNDELGAAGFSDIAVAKHEIEFVFPDEQAWWDWNWSHGSRVFLEALSEDAQQRLRAQIEQAMQQVRNERGFPRTYTALFSRVTP
jgi:SAM-dependent methyltransferase